MKFVPRAVAWSMVSGGLLVVAGALRAQPPTEAPPAGLPALPAVKPLPSVMPVQTGNRGRRLGDAMECMVEPSLVVNVGSPVEGTLSQVLVERGDEVRAGQVVARLNSTVEAANLALRRAQFEFGERKVRRNEELFQKELISQSEKDELQTQFRLAALELRQAEEVLNLRTITSPVAGVVVERFLAPGDRVAQEKIVRIAQVDPLHVEAIVPVDLFGRIRVGSPAEVRLDPLVPGTFKAVVSVVDRVVDPASGTFGVRLALPNPGYKVPAGIRCLVRLSR